MSSKSSGSSTKLTDEDLSNIKPVSRTSSCANSINNVEKNSHESISENESKLNAVAQDKGINETPLKRNEVRKKRMSQTNLVTCYARQNPFQKASTSRLSLHSGSNGRSIDIRMSLSHIDDWNAEFEMIYDWIDRMDFVKTKKNIHRDFSDGVLMAELLKKLWPKLVDLHNYSTANSYENKMKNWHLLNTKIFQKLELFQSTRNLESLAKSEPGTLENLLIKIKKKYESSKQIANQNETSNNEDTSNVIHLNGETISKDKYLNLMKTHEKLKNELMESDEVIKILKNKVSLLEDLLRVKEDNINNLKSELKQIQQKHSTELSYPDDMSDSCKNVENSINDL